MSTKLEKLNALLKIANEGLTRKEFEESFKGVIKLILQAEDRHQKLMNKYLDALTSKVERKLASVKDGKDGKDGINGRDGKDGIDGKDGKDGEPGIPGLPGQSVNIEPMWAEFDALKETIEKKIKEMEKPRLGGGGFSKIHMDGHMIDKETPSGTINGTNKAFTLAVAPNPTASLNVFVNGMLMEEGATNDYTFSGKTITFVTAPPTGSRILANYRK